MKKLNKKAQIIKNALDLFVERGFHGTSMAMIAEKADVGAGTIYHYFESRDTLINEIYSELENQALKSIEEEYPVKGSIRDRFLHLGSALLRYFISHPTHFRYIEQYHNSPYGASLRKDKVLNMSEDHSIFKDLFDEGISQKMIKDLPIYILFGLFFGPLVVLARDHTLGLILLDENLITKIVEACWDGIKR